MTTAFIAGVGPLELAIVLLIMLADRRRPQAARARPSARRGHARVQGLRDAPHRLASGMTTTPARRSPRPRWAVRPARRRRWTARSCASAPERSAAAVPQRHGHAAEAHRARGQAVARRAPRRAAHAGHHLRARVRRRRRRLPVAGRLRPGHGQRAARADVANKKPCDETRDPLEQADCLQQAQKRVTRDRRDGDRSRARRRDDPALRAQAEELERVAAAAVAASPELAEAARDARRGRAADRDAQWPAMRRCC